MSIVRVIAIAWTLAMIGCDTKGDESSAAPPRKQPSEVSGPAIVRGKVTLDGPIPKMRDIANIPCHPGATPLQEEFVVVGKDGGLANVFVWIEGVPNVDGASLPPALLDQANCRYDPHAVGVCVGQTLKIRSSDPTVHNVHYSPDRNESRNLSMTRSGDEKSVSFRSPEFIPVRCDVHPWMGATIGVFGSPFFAVSDGDGGFEIKHLPAGSYKLLAWHERYGQLKQEVTLTSDPMTTKFTYKAPSN